MQLEVWIEAPALRRVRVVNADVVETRHARRKARTRASLLETAQRLMGERGIQATAVGDITDAADVSLATFYNHFASKDVLVQELADELASDLSHHLRDVVAQADDPSHGLARLVDEFFRWFDDDPLRAAFVVELTLGNSTLRDHLGAVLAEVLDAGMRSRRFLRSPLSVTAFTVGGAILGVMLSRLRNLAPAGPATTRELSAQLLRLLGVPAEDASGVVAAAIPQRRR